MHSSAFGLLLHHTQTSAACCVIRQILYIRDRATPPLLSSRTSSYHILRSTTCWVHRAISFPRDPLVSLCVSAGDLGYVKHPHTVRPKFCYMQHLPLKLICLEDALAPTCACTSTQKQTHCVQTFLWKRCTSSACVDTFQSDFVCVIL